MEDREKPLCGKTTKCKVTMMFSPIWGKSAVPKLPAKVGGSCDLEEALEGGRCIIRLAAAGKEELRERAPSSGELQVIRGGKCTQEAS